MSEKFDLITSNFACCFVKLSLGVGIRRPNFTTPNFHNLSCLWRDSFLNQNFPACPTLGPLEIHLFQFWIFSDSLENVLQLITNNILYFLIPFCIFYELKRKKEKKNIFKKYKNFLSFDFWFWKLRFVLYFMR